MSEDMKRIISEESKQKVALQEIDINKIDIIKYKVNCIKAHVHEINEVFTIYEKCNKNDEIINEIGQLYITLYEKNKNEVPGLLELKASIEEFIKDEQSKYIKNLEQSLSLKDTELYSYSKDIQELRKNIEELRQKDEEKSTQINELKKNDKKKSQEIDELEKNDKKKSQEIAKLEENDKKKSREINELKKKMNYIEPIVISLISRKIINYCICKILDNYKKLISIRLIHSEGKEPTYKISFINSVKKVKINDANKLLNTLFDKKQTYNEDSHLEGKDLPPFITDIWEVAKKNFNLDKTELLSFDDIITDDIKSGFNFGAHDLSVNDYLKNVNFTEFGEFVESK